MQSQETETMTRQEIYEYFPTCEQSFIDSLLTDMGYADDTTNFPLSVVEGIEEGLAAMGLAVESQKRLAAQAPEAKQEQAIVLQETAAIATELLKSQNINLPHAFVMTLAKAVTTDARGIAEVLAALQKQSFVRAFNESQAQMQEELLQIVAQSRKVTEAMFSQENIEKMLVAAVPAHKPEIDIDAFIEETKEIVQKQREADEKKKAERQAAQVAQAVEFDVDAFLAEYGVEAQS